MPGFFLTAFFQVPNLLYFLDSPRVTGGHSMFSTLFHQAWTLNGGEIIIAEIAGLFGKDLLGVASAYRGYYNWFEAPGFYVGMLLLLCIPQLFGPSSRPREKLLGICGAVLFLAYMLWPAMRYAVYGFGHSGFRLSTLWVSTGLLVLGLAGLRRARESGTWRAGLVIAATGILFAVLAVAYRAPEDVRAQRAVIVVVFTAIYCVLMWPRDGRPAGVPVRILVAVFACELFLFSMPAFVERNAVKSDGTSSIGSYDDGTLAALALIRNGDRVGDFYRVEKIYRSVYLNDALVQGYSGTKSDYFHGASLTRFVDKMELPRPHPRAAYIGSMIARPEIIDLLGIRYILSRDRKLDGNPVMTYLGRAGKLRVYRNTGDRGMAHLYREV
ncbi:MAG: YfhO family protein, partial [Thermoanaerobaculia bacterium]